MRNFLDGDLRSEVYDSQFYILSAMDKSQFCCLVFGKILYDCLADRTCLGGAARNFAWKLRQRGFPVAMVSAGGRDALGRQARNFLREADIAQQWGADRDEPTGTVDVFLQEGQPSYTILSGVAWDFIEIQPQLDRVPDLLYYGSAAQRGQSAQSRAFASQAASALLLRR